MLVFDSNGTASVTSGLTSSVTGLTIYVDQTYGGTIGTISGATLSPLQIPGGTVYIGRDPSGNGSGSSLVYIKGTGTNALTANVLATASSGSASGFPAVILEGTNLTVNASGGTLAVAPLAGTTTTGSVFTTVGDSTPDVLLGEGATISTVSASGGTVTSLSSNTTALTTLSNNASFRTLGSGAFTTITVGSGSSFIHSGGGNVTTLNLSGEFNRSADTRPITLSTTNLYERCTFNLDNGKAASTTRTTVNLVNTSVQNISVSLPIGEKL